MKVTMPEADMKVGQAGTHNGVHRVDDDGRYATLVV